jgi:hypothetical protein
MTNTESHDSKVLRWGGFAMAAFVAATMMAGMARAEDEHGKGGHGHRQPPPAAYDACKGKKATDTCQVTFGDRKIDGTCMSHDDGQLFCRPARPPGPPPAMLEACKDKKAGDACNVTFDGQTRDGTCNQGRGDHLVCRPAR